MLGIALYLQQKFPNFFPCMKAMPRRIARVFFVMKFTITINQKEAIASGLDLDVFDLIIFDLLHSFSLHPSCKKKQEDGHTYYLFSWKLITNQLPILKITTRQAIQKRMDRLKEAKIISPHPGNQALQQSWYRFSQNAPMLLFDLQTEIGRLGGEPANGGLQEPANGRLHNKDLINKNINEGAALRQDIIDFLSSIVTWVKSNPDKYPKLMYVDFARYWLEPSTGKRKKMLRFQGCEFFDLGRRLGTWFQTAGDLNISKQWEKESEVAALNELFYKLIPPKKENDAKTTEESSAGK